jgi:hypothetical protein
MNLSLRGANFKGGHGSGSRPRPLLLSGLCLGGLVLGALGLSFEAGTSDVLPGGVLGLDLTQFDDVVLVDAQSQESLCGRLWA